MMVVSIEIEPSFRAGNPEVLFERRFVSNVALDFPTYDVSPDGQRFLVVKYGEDKEGAPSRSELIVVQNCFEELKRLAPVGERD